MRERFIYRVAVLILLILLIFSVFKCYETNKNLKEIKSEISQAIIVNDGNHLNAIKRWKKDYTTLQYNYRNLVTKNDELESKLKQNGIPLYEFTEDEIYMLAQCVEAEAGHYDNHALSQRYVTQVILNRLYSSKFPNTLKEVIYQKNKGIPQFSVAYNGAMKDRIVEQETLMNVYKVITHGTDLPRYVCYFYSNKVTGNWVNTLSTYKETQGTIFSYSYKEDY